jgi:hypothetical protein
MSDRLITNLKKNGHRESGHVLVIFEKKTM